ncbi:glycoside hydrolase family 130 protein [bacterium]|nr:glycoside hydrolase family 130 protein [bacterium]
MFRRKMTQRDVVHRWEGNPLIRLQDLDFQCADVWSAGVASYQDDIILLVTIEHLAGFQSIHLAGSDEKGRFHVKEEPFIGARRDPLEFGLHESRGVMDARVTLINGVYYIVYLASGEHGFRLGLATTRDFVKVERHGLISEPDTKTGALFPEKIKGRYARLCRPREGNSIWVSYSHDLIYWGDSELLLSPRAGFWDSSRVGAGPPPMKIPQGWLLIYYGVKETQAGPLFRLGAAILSGEDPVKIVSRSNIPILSPREDYERIGDLSNIVFSTGALVKNNNEMDIIYSGADSCICLGSTTVEEIVETCSMSKEEF